MKFNKTVAYAVAAVVQVAANSSTKPVANRIVCERTQMPERFVLQIMRLLVNGGVLIGVRGFDGGYKLARPAHQITLLDIYESVDSLGEDSDVGFNRLSPVSQRIVANAIEGIVADARKRLAKLTVAELRVASL